MTALRVTGNLAELAREYARGPEACAGADPADVSALAAALFTCILQAAFPVVTCPQCGWEFQPPPEDAPLQALPWERDDLS